MLVINILRHVHILVFTHVYIYISHITLLKGISSQWSYYHLHQFQNWL